MTIPDPKFETRTSTTKVFTLSDTDIEEVVKRYLVELFGDKQLNGFRFVGVSWDHDETFNGGEFSFFTSKSTDTI